MQEFVKPGKLRIIFMGTPEFAVPSLHILLENNYDIAAVITTPDKPAGRGLKLKPSPVKEFALKHGLKLLQPLKLKDQSFITEIKTLKPDLQIVVAFRILPVEVFSIPPMGTFNLHASLLPMYRGAAPINWVIINGEKETGLTTFFIDENVDTGNILLQEKINITENENAGSLHDKLMIRGASLVLKTTEMIESGNSIQVPQFDFKMQDVNLMRAPKIQKSDCLINWNRPGREVINLIRGLSPYPAAFSFLLRDEKSIHVKIYDAAFYPAIAPEYPGKLNSDNRHFLHVWVQDGFISINSLQLEGKKKMNTEQFLAGFRDLSGYTMK